MLPIFTKSLDADSFLPRPITVVGVFASIMCSCFLSTGPAVKVCRCSPRCRKAAGCASSHALCPKANVSKGFCGTRAQSALERQHGPAPDPLAQEDSHRFSGPVAQFSLTTARCHL